MSDSSLYVYALVAAGLDASLGTGLTGEPLHLVTVGAIDAVVGAMDDRPSIAPGSLRAHDDVVRRIVKASDAILPLRFGAMVTGARELEEGLAPRVASLVSALARTRGCDQMTLRVYDAGAELPRYDMPAGPIRGWRREPSAPPPHELARVREALASLVRDERIEVGGPAPLRASAFHLVARPDTANYATRIEDIAADAAGVRLVVTGPWPPYAFAELE